METFFGVVIVVGLILVAASAVTGRKRKSAPAKYPLDKDNPRKHTDK